MLFGELLLTAFPVDLHILIVDRIELRFSFSGFQQSLHGFDSAVHGLHLFPGRSSGSAEFIEPAVQIGHAANAVFPHISGDIGKALKVFDSCFLLTVGAVPGLASFFLALIETLDQKIDEHDFLRLHIDLNDRFFDFRQPVSDLGNSSLDSCNQDICFLDLAVQITDIGLDASAFHSGNGRPHVDGGYLVDALSFIGLHADALRTFGGFQVSVLNVLPGLSPRFGIVTVIPIGGEDLSELPLAVLAFDPVAFLVKLILAVTLR